MADSEYSDESDDYEPMVAGEATDGGSEERTRRPNPILAKLTGLILVVPGIILYLYILYVAFAMLVYPGSVAPFTGASKPTSSKAPSSLGGNATKEKDARLRKAILSDTFLLVLFLLQHTLMACGALKRLFDRVGMLAIVRPLYVCSTCCVIQLVHQFWVSTPDHTVWTCTNGTAHYVLIAVHTASWLSIACSLFTIDYLELLGIKQIYYSYHGFSNPLHYKSAEQQRLLTHMRHPVFLAPLLVIWAVPVMPFDRLLVAVLLPLYLAWGNGVDRLDVGYVSRQFRMKSAQLLSNGKSD